jgi:hypothetical protein
MSFPSSPSDGQQVTINSIVYQYSSSEGTWTRLLTSATYSTDNVARQVASLASSNTVYLQGVDAWQNTRIQAAFDQANTGGGGGGGTLDQIARNTANSASANTIVIQGVDNSQNTRIDAINIYSFAAYAQANSASSNTIVIQGVNSSQNTRLDAINIYSFAAYAQANSANVLAQAAFDKANTGGAFGIDNVARLTANSASSNTIYTQGVDVTQNSRITFVEGHSQAAFTQANLALQTDIAIQDEVNIIKNVNITQNTRIQAAFDKANTGGGITSLGGFAANNILTVNSAGYISNTTNLNFYNSNNTLVVTGNVVGGGIRSTTSENPPDNPVIGDIWYETGTDVIYRYTNDGGSSYWIDVSGPEFSGSSPAHRSIAEFIATANQNSFSTVYNVNSVDVLRNGLRLPSTDYVANNGTSIILDTPCNANDVVTIINFYTTSLNVVLTANARPSNLANGTILWNSANNVLETYTGTGWSTLASQNYTIQYMIVAAGGGGGVIGGGGGAGGLITGSSAVFPNDIFTFVIGAGGNSGTSATRATNGSNTTAFLTTALGGGGGGNHVLNTTSNAGLSGGSGGGGSDNGAVGGSGTAGQGNAGGTGVAGTPATQRIGGGGGGAGTAGSTAASGGHGGEGYLWLDGYYYSGGGGAGGHDSSTGGNGGLGGGGGGSVSSGTGGTGGGSARNNGSNGAAGGNLRGGNGGAGTGGGGGGCSWQTPTIAAQGGSGTVIVRYSGNARGTGGTISSSGGFTYHVFTSSGTFTA